MNKAMKNIKPQSMTCKEASERHPGATTIQLNRMLLKGQRLSRVYGKNAPQREVDTALFGKKVGTLWYIPVKELDRVFLP